MRVFSKLPTIQERTKKESGMHWLKNIRVEEKRARAAQDSWMLLGRWRVLLPGGRTFSSSAFLMLPPLSCVVKTLQEIYNPKRTYNENVKRKRQLQTIVLLWTGPLYMLLSGDVAQRQWAHSISCSCISCIFVRFDVSEVGGTKFVPHLHRCHLQLSVGREEGQEALVF